MLKKIGLLVLAIIVIMQFFRIDKTNPEVIAENDFLYAVAAPDDVAQIIKTSCYDCHSNTTKYPWYSNVAPISWWLKDHIDEGREELNFSEWETFEQKRKLKKLKECVEELEEKKMPLDDYLITHSEAELTDQQREMLVNWFKETLNNFENETTNETTEESNEVALSLDNGKKWKANKETVDGINNMLAIMATPLAEERIVLYVARGEQLMKEFETIVAKCNMTGEAHEQLHHYIFPLKEQIETLIACEDITNCDLTHLAILRQLHLFKDYFELDDLAS